MTCSEFLAELDDYIDASVSATLRADLEAHLKGCEHCEITLVTTRKTIEVYRTNELYELPDSLRKRLHDAILAKCKNC